MPGIIGSLQGLEALKLASQVSIPTSLASLSHLLLPSWPQCWVFWFVTHTGAPLAWLLTCTGAALERLIQVGQSGSLLYPSQVSTFCFI